MAELDVSELLVDGDLTSSFTVQRRLQSVNSFGETSTTIITFQNLRGGVYPTGEQSLTRADAYQSQANTISVTTQFQLRGVSADATGSYQPDIVNWRGNNYVVRTLSEFAYGAGFVVAECISTSLLDQPDSED